MQNPHALTYSKSIIEFGKPDVVFLAKKKYELYPKKSLKLIPRKVAPSIPKKQIMPESLSGDRNDSAGPGQYDAKVAPVKNRKPQYNFGISGVKREVFKVEITPGPSEYQTESKNQQLDSLGSYVFKMKEGKERQPLTF